MSPTVFNENGYRFFFFSREETRMHVHVHCEGGEVKFWLEPELQLAYNYGLRRVKLKQVEHIIEDHFDEIIRAWKKHFAG